MLEGRGGRKKENVEQEVSGIEGRGARCFGKLFLIAVPMRVRAEGDRAVSPRSRVFLGGARHAAHHRNVLDTTRNKVFIELAPPRDRNQRPLPAGESRSVYGIVVGRQCVINSP